MTDTTATPGRSWNWLKIALVASLALNVLIGAAVATRYYRGGGAERFPPGGYVQLIPRKFLGELPRERRREVMQIVNRYRKELRTEREETKALTLKLADAIGSDTYSPEQAKTAVLDFTGQGSKLVSRGGDAALEILGMLTPEERKELADAIRQRAGSPRN
jgi:uncharacterized membrane protein